MLTAGRANNFTTNLYQMYGIFTLQRVCTYLKTAFLHINPHWNILVSILFT